MIIPTLPHPALADPTAAHYEPSRAAMVDVRLSNQDIGVFRTLCSLWAAASSQDNCVAMTYPGLADQTGISVVHARRAVRRLAAAGYLTAVTTRPPSPSGHGLVNGATEFRLVLPISATIDGHHPFLAPGAGFRLGDRSEIP